MGKKNTNKNEKNYRFVCRRFVVFQMLYNKHLNSDCDYLVTHPSIKISSLTLCGLY